MKKVGQNNDLHLSDDRYLAALKRIRADIAAGREFNAQDSNCPGDKFNDCTWGMCSRVAEHWPNKDDHLWPEEFIEHGLVAPKYYRDGQHCPLDAEPPSDGHTYGCFHRCRVFRRKYQTPHKTMALLLFDAAIEKYEKKLKEQT